jgi:DNA-binding helix-hairpin-helix protein with protein kinase domain
MCDVGVSTHQPPELQGVSLRNKLRTQNHDNFGLAVIIFQLLFIGRHPFSGMYLGSGDMPIEKAIKEFRFAYSKSASSNKMKRPPGTLPLNAVSEQVGSLFERAFSSEGVNNGRPSAQEWITSLKDLSNQLRQCNGNSSHKFFSKLVSCPWCSVEGQTGIILFDVGISIKQNVAIFNLSAIWAQINNVSHPGPSPVFPEPASLKKSPTEDAIRLGKTRRLRIKISISLVIVCVIAIKIAPVGESIAFLSFLASIFASLVYYKSGPEKKRKESEKQHSEILKLWEANKERWDKEAGDELFVKQKRHLEQIRMDYLNIQKSKQQRIKQLESDKERYQLKKYLDNYRIAKASISGIGPSRKATLLSYGIETAKDVTYNDIIKIPGFGPAYTKKIVEWRKNLEKKFVYNPSIGLDPKDIAAIEKEISTKKAELEKNLLNGAKTLTQLSHQINNRRQLLKAEIDRNLNILAQLEADLKVL